MNNDQITIKRRRRLSSILEHSLREGLAGSTSLKSFTLEIESYHDDNVEWRSALGEVLASGSCANGDAKWGRGLGEGLVRNTSLESLTIKIMKPRFVSSKWALGLGKGLAGNTSL